MCGIAGYFGNFSPELLQTMTQAIAHRGPDGEGAWFDSDAAVGLGHRRLAIIDLSPLGHQPMWDVTRQCVITYNGEIYNYAQLRQQLVEQGYRFNSHSDTEVLLNLYLRYGTEMLSHLNGIYAFAIYDARSKELFVARDPLGVKPLYYTQSSRGFLFASELKALLCDENFSRQLNPSAVLAHLNFCWAPGEMTMLKNVKRLAAGHAMILREHKIIKQWQFYQLPYDQAISTLSAKEAQQQLDVLLTQAVKRQLIADVPVGAFLSGGLDSSAIVAKMRELNPQKKIDCFTMSFDEDMRASEDLSSDLPYAKAVAKHLQVDLHVLKASSTVINDLAQLIFHLDEPLADPAAINTFLISQFAYKNGLKVLLSGAGGDDIFAGYRRHFALMHERYWTVWPQWSRELALRGLGAIAKNNIFLKRAMKVLQHASLPEAQRISSYFQWISPALISTMLSEDFKAQLSSFDHLDYLASELNSLPASTHKLNKMLHLDGKFFLTDHNLLYTDKMSMVAHVETRVPLLDLDLVKFAASLPVHFKQHGSQGKWIFKKAMEPYLPKNIIYRPKTGFATPLRTWFRSHLSDYLNEYLNPEALKETGIFNPLTIARMLEANRKGEQDLSYPLFTVLCLQLWQRNFLMSELAT